MSEQLPPGQGPIDPRGAFTPPPAPGPGVPPTPAMGAAGYRPMMPPPTYPPVVMPPPPYPPVMMPPPRRGGAGRAVLMTLLVLLLILSVLFNIVLLGASLVGSAFDGRDVVRNTIRSGEADQEIAVVPLEGIITDSTSRQFDRLMRQIDEDRNLKAIVLEIDSPGGEVTPSDEVYRRLVRFKHEHPGVPVAASMRSMATSGAYYAACGADHLLAEPTSITGSIGVIWPRFNAYELMHKWGIKDTTIVSSGTPFKDAGSPFQPESQGNEAYLHGLVDSAFLRFKAVVSDSRKGKLKPDIEQIANGKAYTAPEAKDNGLIDQIGDLDDAIAWAAAQRGLTKPNVVRVEEKGSLLDRFPFAQSQDGRTSRVGVDVRGIRIDVDRQSLDRLMRGGMMYLPRDIH